MRTAKDTSVLSPIRIDPASLTKPYFSRARTVRYIGSVTRATNEQALKEIDALQVIAPEDEIALFVTSTGGATGTAMSFYDMLRHVSKPKLVTIGSGDVDSSGIIIFLTGQKRYITKNTTLLFHAAGRTFDSAQRLTTREMEAMLAEDRLKDEQYASLIAENSRGMLTENEVLEMMKQETVLSPDELVSFGLADAVLR
ncbi:MAG: peptidase ClpP [Parcubacteria group bacterium]|nr:peptidase ClpP [Parcubacteria group bacterium]